MEEQNKKIPENQEPKEVKEKTPDTKKPMPKIAIIIGAVAVVVVAVAVALIILLGGNKNSGNDNDSANPPETPMHTHNFGEWETTNAATCTAGGSKERYCPCGEKQTSTISITEHSYGEWEIVKEATCKNEGKATRKCAVCNIEESKVLDKTNEHTEVIDAAISATCTTTGLTEGKHCSVCNKVILAQNKTPTIGHTYDNKYDEKCNVCGFERDAECAHTETETIPGKSATCTSTGLSDGEKCKKCGEVVTSQAFIPMKSHTEVTIPAVEATCTKTGLSEGKKCSVCEKILVAQQTTSTINHIESDWIIDKVATKTEDGARHTECIMCGKKLSEDVILATGSVGLAYTVNSDNQSCTITGIGTCIDTHVVIPTQIESYKVTDIGDKAFADCTDITAIEIPSTVKTIGTRAFYGCTGITDITIPASVSSIGTQIFYKASNLATVYYNCTYGSETNQFLNLSHITKIVFGGSKVPNYICYNNTALQTVEILDSVTSIDSYAFQGCTSLTSIVIGDSVTSIGWYAFYRCTGLTSIVISENSKLTDICWHAFSSCTGLTSIEIPDSVTSIDGYAFYHCTGLTSITIPDSVTSIGEWAFAFCSSLTSIMIGDNVTSIGTLAFYDCTGLTDVYITDIDAWYNISFSNSASNPMCNGANLYLNGNLVTEVTVPDTVTSLKDTFAGCKSIVSVTIPDSVTSIGSSTFGDCTGLTSITYAGTIAQWDSIEKGRGWSLGAGDYTIYCTDGQV